MIFIQSIRENDINPDGGKQVELGVGFFRDYGWAAESVNNISIHYKDTTIATSFKVRGSQRGGDRVGVDCKEYEVNGHFPLKEFFINTIGLKPEHIDKVSFILESLNEEGTEFNLYFANLPVISGQNVITLPFVNSWEQKIIYGAPGTGKSQSLKNHGDDRNIKTYRTTFHPETDYTSFVGCYKPITNKREKVVYTYTEQVFLQAYYAAWNNPTEKYLLLIEEINRGNCAQIFGDIFQLLDRREDGFSNYPIIADVDIQRNMRSNLPRNYDMVLRSEYLDSNNRPTIDDGWKYLAIPPNLSICATMNTSDQSLYKMDSAFKRRWLTVYVPIKYKAERVDGTPIECDKGIAKLEEVKLDFYEDKPWLEVLYAINSFIRSRLNSTSKQMGQWFIVPNKDGENFADIKFEVFRDKLMFYLFNDVFKKSDDLNQPFGKEDDGFLFLFEDLCVEQDGGKQLCKTFLDNIVTEFPYPTE